MKNDRRGGEGRGAYKLSSPEKKGGPIREGNLIEDLRYVVFVKRILYFSMGIPLSSVVIDAFSRVIERARIIAVKVFADTSSLSIRRFWGKRKREKGKG